MSKFNNTQTSLTENLAGGQAYEESNELKLISLVLTSFVNDQYYRSADEAFKELINLLPKNPEFAAKAAIYARQEFGMRSITHVLAAELCRSFLFEKKEQWLKHFYSAVVRRPDDITEILAYYLNKYGKPIPSAMKRGLAKAFDKFDEYQLAKYRASNKKVSLIDAVNLVHPKPTDKNESALKKLMKNELVSYDTWESELSEIGQTKASIEAQAGLKEFTWNKLITERKIGYFALLRNLRNILQQAPSAIEAACELLIDEKLIKNSLVLPFRYFTAYQEIKKIPDKQARLLLQSINKAADIACKNVPIFDGETLVALDTSGSMAGRPGEIGALFAAILAKTNNADLICFSNNAEYTNIDLQNSVLSITESINFAMGGTNFHSIFQTLNKSYNRIIILSDMQAWIPSSGALWDSSGLTSSLPKKSYQEYKNKYNCDPILYSFDLTGYGTLQFPERNVYCLAGFSEKIFDIMKLLELDNRALINKINSINLLENNYV